ncbi:GNAT family N-acetyltransferase [Sphingobium sufflavum]|uniref:GNAT family N-acetyltransferase n=1 Tax=Sphingobium sufflavum TaxID=1129547 RepID=UPI001F23372A|nr:GNAT family N-acetyltransferase [Sphingobium sufflavum]MCE7797238.1 GNAT family N-acetyltransferase [Sphingobium sufflavum]
MGAVLSELTGEEFDPEVNQGLMNEKILLSKNPGVADRLAILRPLKAFNEAALDLPPPEAVAVLIRDREQKRKVGGLWGLAGWGWFQIELLFVPENLRSQGWGRRLIERAACEARERDCHSMWVETFSFQAVDFYKKMGFEMFGELDNYPNGNSRVFLKKSLIEI